LTNNPKKSAPFKVTILEKGQFFCGNKPDQELDVSVAGGSP